MGMKIIKGGVLIDGTGGPPVENAVVAIEGEKITSVGAKGKVVVPKGDNVEIIEADGRTIMPGLIETHAHIFMDGEMIHEFAAFPLNDNPLSMAMKSIPRLKRVLEMGITTYRDGGSGWGWFEVALRDAINRGDIIGPRYFATGYHLTVTGGHGYYLPPWLGKLKPVEQHGMHCDGPDEWRKAARLNIYNGTDNVKLVASREIIAPGITTAAQATLEELTAGVEEAHKMGKKAIVHAHGPTAIKNGIKAGADVIVHGFFMDEECAEMMVKNNVFLEGTNFYVRRTLIEKGKEGKLPDDMINDGKKSWEDRKKNFKMYLEKGVKIIFGSDAGVPFVPQGDNAGELKMFVELGMSPMDAILAATKTAAEAIGIEDKVGTIEKGKIADIILIDGDPSKDIELLCKKEKIKMVMKEGNIVINR